MPVKFYHNFKSISKTIAQTPIDYSRERLSKQEIGIVMNRYNIRLFENEDDFKKAYAKDARNVVMREMDKSQRKYENAISTNIDIKLNEWWDYYKKRYELVATGQYDDIRAESYREQYLRHLRLANVDSDVIVNIEKLSLEDWKKLYQQPDANVSSIKNRELPSLSNIYSYDSHTTDMYKIIKDEIKEAFKSAGIEFVNYDTKEEDNKVLMRRKFDKYAEAVLDGRITLHAKDDGSISIPFIGNTKGKNADVANEFMEYFATISENYY